ncbi:hypothetical protein D3C81_2097490 [compost metagenome]
MLQLEALGAYLQFTVNGTYLGQRILVAPNAAVLQGELLNLPFVTIEGVGSK